MRRWTNSSFMKRPLRVNCKEVPNYKLNRSAVLKNGSIKALSLWLFVRNSWQRFDQSFHLNIRKKFFYSEINHSLEHPPQEHGGVPITKGGFFLQLGRVLDKLIRASFPTKSWTRQSFNIPSNLGFSVLLQNFLCGWSDLHQKYRRWRCTCWWTACLQWLLQHITYVNELPNLKNISGVFFALEDSSMFSVCWSGCSALWGNRGILF